MASFKAFWRMFYDVCLRYTEGILHRRSSVRYSTTEYSRWYSTGHPFRYSIGHSGILKPLFRKIFYRVFYMTFFYVYRGSIL